MCVRGHAEQRQRLPTCSASFGLLAVRPPPGPPVVRQTTDEIELAMKASSGRPPTMWGTTSFGDSSGSVTFCTGGFAPRIEAVVSRLVSDGSEVWHSNNRFDTL